MYSDVMNKSLESNKKFVESLSKEKLEDLMMEFDNYEIENHNCWFQNSSSFNKYLYESYKKFKLFESFNVQERKSVNLNQNIIKKSPNKALFLL
ncbi:hypothetical protein [Tenacibaculum finnmarkense]|uniref:hypothetical protein n=1 Tax=Tenacibaculum finnmarkense TaxID=2781243 RepID=UPI00187B7A13|nr:hypothetical protein [Tenacibaculum finnmarkense]MBE7659053.1 hypothetical protein [Tenacibaculum finnmarkense genomovar finnmarkense]MCG8251144.1 hypothetical protein [Tenacibaculum finnmarkense genomovar finnmarkense]MCG8814255.1 hypothetical protein [Tenacibaculum finnmarkense]MCG8819280.1 hypothetical protein [Tenacibaculum finnmarkense]